MGRKRVEPDQRKRLAPDERKAQLLDEAVRQAEHRGVMNINRRTVGEGCGVTDGLVARYFGTIQGLRTAVVAEAIMQGRAALVRRAVAEGYPASQVPPEMLD